MPQLIEVETQIPRVQSWVSEISALEGDSLVAGGLPINLQVVVPIE